MTCVRSVRGRMFDRPIAGGEIVDPLLAIPRLDALSRKVPVAAPWEAAGAARLDGESLEAWLRHNTTGGKRFMDLARASGRAIFGAEPRELSLLFVLFFIAASGDERTPGTLERNFSTRNGAQQDRIAGGTQQIADRLAAQLGTYWNGYMDGAVRSGERAAREAL